MAVTAKISLVRCDTM